MFTSPKNIRLPVGPKPRTAATHAQWVLLLLLSMICGTEHSAAADDAGISKEYQIKAAFLYSFTKFIEWSPQRFPASDSPIVIGVLGKNPFGEELARIVQSRKVNGRGFTIKMVYSNVDLPSVHLLFVPNGEEIKLVEKTLDLIDSPGTLTVGESDQFSALGGGITFVNEVDKVRFTINRDATERAGIKISAQLLKLAVPVRKKA